MGAANSTLRWDPTDSAALRFLVRKPNAKYPVGYPTTASRHPSHSLTYEYAHEGSWNRLLARCHTHPNDASYVDKFHNTALHLSCRRQPPINVIKALLVSNPSAVQITTVDGLTPLHFACYCGGSLDVISTLVEHYPGACTVTDKKGRTPLHFATAGFRTRDRVHVIQKLLTTNSAVVNWQDGRGRTPLSLMFEDYAEEIEEGEVMSVLTTLFDQQAEKQQQAGDNVSQLRPQAIPEGEETDEAGGWHDDQNSESRDQQDKDDGEKRVEMANINLDEVRECWESITLLVKAAYYHINMDNFLTLNKTSLSSPSNDDMSVDSFLVKRQKEYDDEEEDDSASFFRASEMSWNIVHAVVGVQKCPPKFVEIVLKLYPEKVKKRDAYGNLPLHVITRAKPYQHFRDDGPSIDTSYGSRCGTEYDEIKSLTHTVCTAAPYEDEETIEKVKEERNYSLIVRDLLVAHPEAASKRDARGKLPIHLAIESGKSWKMGGVKDLLEAHPAGFREEEIHLTIINSLCSSSALRRESVGTGFRADQSLNSYSTPKTNEDENDEDDDGNEVYSSSRSLVSEEEDDIDYSPIQHEASRTLYHLLRTGRWKNTIPLLEELLSRATMSNYSKCVDRSLEIATKAAIMDALGTVLMYENQNPPAGDSTTSIEDKFAACADSAIEIGWKMLYHPNRCVRMNAGKVLGAACDAVGVDVTTKMLKDVILSNNKNESSHHSEQNIFRYENAISCIIAVDHGKACGIYRIFASDVGKKVDYETFQRLVALIKKFMQNDYSIVREVACLAAGTLIASAEDPHRCLKDMRGPMLKCVRPTETMEVQEHLARGLTYATRKQPKLFQGKHGIAILDGALMLSMVGGQTVKERVYDFLWLALEIGEGQDGLYEYMKVSAGENGKVMMTLVSKFLGNMDSIADDEAFL